MVSYEDFVSKKESIAVVGLGYVGLPLAHALSKKFNVIGFDIKSRRIESLRNGHDWTKEVDDSEIAKSSVHFTANPSDLKACRVIIIAVPTPIDAHRSPDLSPVIGATQTVGAHLSKGTVVCYESTVYPGVTEEICVPLLEKESHLTFGQDFAVGYSPERINPGDKIHRLETIRKIVSGSDQATAHLLSNIYGAVVTAGIHLAPSIKVAEAAKVIENTQRDINIALMNELAMIFNKMGIDTLDVLQAAGSKWNFLPFRPGLVGGHCIGVDPYYLTFKAEEIGLHPEVILAGRRTNDHMGKYVAETCVKQLIAADKPIKGAQVGILGFTFKENVPDIRNTRVIDIVHELEEYGITALVHDPCADTADCALSYPEITLRSLDHFHDLDAVILAVAHKEYRDMDMAEIAAMFTRSPRTVLDLKGILDREKAKDYDLNLWRL